MLLVGSQRLRSELDFLEDGRHGAHVAHFTTRTEALSHLRAQAVDLLLTEEQLPDGTAASLFDEIGRLQRLGKPPALFVISDAPLATQPELLKRYHQAEGVFFRPFDEHALMSALFQALKRRSQSTRVSGARLSVDNVTVELLFQGAKAPRRAMIGNLGRGGMFLMMDDPLPREGDAFTFRIDTERGRHVRIEGRGVVRWIRAAALEGLPRGVGTQFTAVSGDNLRDLQDLIKNLKKGSASSGRT